MVLEGQPAALSYCVVSVHTAALPPLSARLLLLRLGHGAAAAAAALFLISFVVKATESLLEVLR